MIRCLAIGKNKDQSLKRLESEYIKRISAFSKVEVLEVKDEPNQHVDRSGEIERVKEKEGRRALEKIGAQDFVVLLDLHGQMLSSELFSQKMDRWISSSRPIVFVIAGSLGPSVELIERADMRWKLSDLTFTHLMTRVLVLEQIYRSMMINHHRTYHK